MKAYECTRCDSFVTSEDPESQACMCDDIEENLRANLATATTELTTLRAELQRVTAERDARLRSAEQVCEAAKRWLLVMRMDHDGSVAHLKRDEDVVRALARAVELHSEATKATN